MPSPKLQSLTSEEPDMPTTIPLVLREATNARQPCPSRAMSASSRRSLVRSRMPLWIVVAFFGSLALAWVLPPASSYHVAIPTPQWITGL